MLNDYFKFKYMVWNYLKKNYILIFFHSRGSTCLAHATLNIIQKNLKYSLNYDMFVDCLVRVFEQQFLVFKHQKLWAQKKKNAFGKNVF